MTEVVVKLTVPADLVRAIAVDIITSAEGYPDIVRAKSYEELHGCYDVNMSVLFGVMRTLSPPAGDWNQEVWRAVNAALDELDRILQKDGFTGLLLLTRLWTSK